MSEDTNDALAQPEGLAVHAGIARMMKRRGSERADTLDVAASVAIEQLIARVQELGRDKERLDSGCILTHERDEFGGEYQCERSGLDLRAAIDAAIRARGAMPDLTQLTARGAVAWAGVGAQALRDGEDIRARGVQGEHE